MKKAAKKPTIRQPRKKALTTEQVRSLFEDQLRKRYWSEKELVLLLPQLVKRATSYELVTAIQEHLSISEQQVLRLIHVFDAIDERAAGTRSLEMNEFIQKGRVIVEGSEFGYNTDSAIIEVCQLIMADEVQSYTIIRDYAKALGEKSAVKYLNEAIREESTAHKMLTEIGLSAIYFDQAG